MKVKDLVAELATMDQDAEVYVYSQIDEGGNGTAEVLSAEQAKETLYFKGDAPWNEDDDNFVVIG